VIYVVNTVSLNVQGIGEPSLKQCELDGMANSSMNIDRFILSYLLN
jgi:hypothetical protein